MKIRFTLLAGFIGITTPALVGQTLQDAISDPHYWIDVPVHNDTENADILLKEDSDSTVHHSQDLIQLDIFSRPHFLIPASDLNERGFIITDPNSLFGSPLDAPGKAYREFNPQ